MSGISATLVMTLTNNYFALFAIAVLGANNYQVGMISSLPQFLSIFGTIAGAFVVNKLERKKGLVSGSTLLARLFLIMMVFVVYLPAEYRVWVFVLLVGFMNLPGSISVMSWQTMIGDLISEKRRNEFFSTRNRVMTLISMGTTLVLGIILGLFDKSNAVPYQALFFTGFVFGLMEVIYLMKHQETPRPVLRAARTIQFGRGLYQHKPYVNFMIAGLVFNFAWQMAWSLFSIYQIRDAHATGFWLSIFLVANQISQVASFKWWGRMSDRYGTVPMLFLAAFGMGSAPILTILSTNLYYLTAINLITGAFQAGTVLLLFNQLLAASKEDNRTAYISNYNALLSIIGFIAPQFGVWLLETFSMDMAMTLSTLFRCSSAFLFVYLFKEDIARFSKIAKVDWRRKRSFIKRRIILYRYHLLHRFPRK